MDERFSKAKQNEMERRIRHLMVLEQWAVKAREELDKYWFFVVGEGTDEAEDRNNEEVIALCKEYDALISR